LPPCEVHLEQPVFGVHPTLHHQQIVLVAGQDVGYAVFIPQDLGGFV
jgi:hypothetical protein